MAIEFNIYLKDEDWVSTMGGWRCDALLIPGTKLEALYYDGKKADNETDLGVARHIIRWSSNAPRPQNLLVTISLAGDLPQLEQEKLRLEKEKLNLEHKKAYLENRWKIIAAIGAVLSSFLTFGATHFAKPFKSQRPYIYTYSQKLTISPDKCLSSLDSTFRNYRLGNITPVQGGIYGEKGNYNVYASCNDTLDIIFLVVSGADQDRTKTIKNELSRLLP